MARHIKNNCGGFLYTYTSYGQLQTLTYPSGFSIIYSYTSTEKLHQIRNSKDNSLIYKVDSRNEFGATTLCTFGNALVIDYTYNPF
ncbi:MAG: hypothetical protein FWF70_05695 [Bacteroidetes bacterium]|nr:hypothetical protein [Bacteroidota bacterium]MCL1968356.1 hypothetical protein [Bacteroidota bacterium]